MAGISRATAAAIDPGAEMWSSAHSWQLHVAAQERAAAAREARRKGSKPTRRQLQKIRAVQDKPAPDEPVEVRVKAYRNDAKVTISRPKAARRPVESVRGEITSFSPAARRRLKFAMRNTADLWTGFVTLTYPPGYGTDGRRVKKDLNAYLQMLRRRKIAYLWVLEFQANGAPHFHICIRGWLPKSVSAHAWYSIVGSGNEKHLKAGTNIQAIKNPDDVEGYMSAYATKLEQKTVPKAYQNVGRFWGASNGIMACMESEVRATYAEAARALRDLRNKNRAEYRRFKKAGDGFRWRWSGLGFVARGGGGVYRRALRRAVIADAASVETKIYNQAARAPGAPWARAGELGEAIRLTSIAAGMGVVSAWVDKRNGVMPRGLTASQRAAWAGQVNLDGTVTPLWEVK